MPSLGQAKSPKKTFWVQTKYWYQKSFWPKNFGHKKLDPNKFWVQQILDQKNFGSKKILV